MENTTETNLEKTPNKFGQWLKKSNSIRLFIIGVLTLVLLIPLFFVQNLIQERSVRQRQVINEINGKWGEEVLVLGPVLKLPYTTVAKRTITDPATKETCVETYEKTKNLFILPDRLDINAQVKPEIKKRGMYRTSVYTAKMKFAGNFSLPDLTAIDISRTDLIWKKAKVILKTSNLKGVREKVAINVNGHHYNLSSSYEPENKQDNNKVALNILESSPLRESDNAISKPLSFNLDLVMNGSEYLRFIPVGKTTTAQMTSPWLTNNFVGNYLPYNNDKQTKTGVDARWKVLDINRPFPKVFSQNLPELREYAFGVNFMVPVDEYQKSERSTKYGFLVIGLTFLIFFLIQTMSKIYMHPFNYLMIGLALVIFYTLLISISEHSGFLIAYLIAGLSVIVLITLYSKAILNRKFALFIMASLTMLYTFIYVIVQLENYALLVGSIGLFSILAAVMYTSRKLDWGSN